MMAVEITAETDFFPMYVLDDVRRISGQDRVYFVASLGTGLVKIGHSRDVRRRLGELQTASSAPLLLSAAVPGSRAQERELHHLFADDRARGEWFRPSARLTHFISMLGVGIQTEHAISKLQPGQTGVASWPS